jgi:heat shock protein HslJ
MRRVASVVVLVAVAMLAAACGSGHSELTGKTWTLRAVTQDVSGFHGVIPHDQHYTIEFLDDNSFAATADCNSVAGVYYAGEGGSMTIKPGPTTLVACPPGSLGDAYTAALGKTTSYAVSGGQLTLRLSGGGNLQFG